MEEKLGIKTKKLMFEELKKKLDSFPNFVITNYKGLSSPEIEELRKKLSRFSSKYFIIKNSIVKRAFDELDLKELSQFIKGEVGIGFAGDIIATSKILVDFSKEHAALQLNCAYINGKVESHDRINQLAKLPPQEILRGVMLSYMKSPITGFVCVLKSLLRNLVYVINSIKESKIQEEGGKQNG